MTDSGADATSSTPAAVAIGAVAGLAAAAAMSAVMVAAERACLLPSPPPHDIAIRTMARTGAAEEVPADLHDDVGWAMHYAFGASTGAAFGAIRSLTRIRGPLVPQAMAFGVLVWLVSYQGWVPALRLLPPASDDDPSRPPVMLGAHVVYGAVLGAAIRAMTPDNVTRR